MDAIEADLGQLTLETAGIVPQVGSSLACKARLQGRCFFPALEQVVWHCCCS